MPKLNTLKLTVEQGDELYRFLQARALVKQYQDRSHELVYDNDGTIDAYASLSPEEIDETQNEWALARQISL